MNCLDAETLAAWMDDGLKGAALEDVQAHVAGCDRCQSLLGAIGRTRAAVPAPGSERAPRRWLAWAVPLAAAVTAIVVWTAVPRRADVPLVSPPAAAVQQYEPAAPAAAPPAATENRPVQPRAGVAASSSAAADAKGEIAQFSPETITETALPPPPATESRAADKLAARAPAAAPAPVGNLCGPAWTVAPPGTPGMLTAGSSPSAEVCWVVGRGGLVLRSTDRRTWQRVNFPEMTDLSAVRSTDARSASVSTSNGRTFRTTDGGQTWAAQ